LQLQAEQEGEDARVGTDRVGWS